jgi:hypothetical protein
MSEDRLKIIETRRHSRIREKLSIWELIADSYVGGQHYVSKNYLFQYPKENSTEYYARKKRAIFSNHTQPLSDIIAGFIYKTPPERKFIPELSYLKDNASRNKNLDAFMLNLSIQSLLYTQGVLVDSPKFDENSVKTLADRENQNLNPYLVRYSPEKIRDYSIDERMELNWILLDNTYIDKADAFQEAVEIKEYRLWTRDFYQDFVFPSNDEPFEGPAISHGLGEVPFVFVNWRDIDGDYIEESIFEDIAMFDRQIYNILSYLDEMLAAGTFKNLFFPIFAKTDLPDEIMNGGIGSLSVVPYPGESSNPPHFAGAELTEIESFLKAYDLYLREIYAKLGMNEDREKQYVQSGKAKDKEFEKLESILRNGAKNMQNAEKRFFELAAKWEGKPGAKVDITYNQTFITEDLDLLLTRLYQVFGMPYQTAKSEAAKEIIKKVLTETDMRTMKKIDKEIEQDAKESDTEPQNLDTNKLVEQEKQERETANADK